MMLKVDKDLSRKFASMSFISAILIVVLHTFSGRSDGGLGHIVGNFMQDGICRMAIPWFFFAAGFFLAGHMNDCRRWWFHEVSKRVRTIMVPFWFWSIIAFLFYLSFAMVIRYVHYDYHGHQPLQWLSKDGVWMILGVDPWKSMPTMWFMRTLFVFVLISPIVRFFHYWFVALSLLLYVLTSYVDIDIPSMFELRGLFYFASGICLRLKPFPLPRYWCEVSVVSAIVALTSKFWCLESDNPMAYTLFDIIMVPFIMLSIWKLCDFVVFPNALTNLCFPIYLIHALVAYFCTAIYGVLHLSVGGVSFGLGLIRFAVALLLSIVFATLIKRLLPRIAFVVFGGRI